MQSLYKCSAISLAGVVLSVACLSAQTIQVEKIRSNPQAHVNEIRTVEGIAVRYVDQGTSTTGAFYLEDDFGHQIRVVTGETLPPRNSRVRVTGLVSLDRTGDPFITASTIVMQNSASAGPQPRTPEAATAESRPESGNVDRDGDGVRDDLDRCLNTSAGATVDATGCAIATFTIDPVLVGGIGLLLIAAVWWLLNRRRTRLMPAAGTAVASNAKEHLSREAGQGTAASEAAFDGKTIKFSRPPTGTMKLLPGHLEVIEGADAGEIIRFMKISGQPGEITFGRVAGRPYTHIELKEPTVSREHARMHLQAGTWVLENRSTTNPVVVNGHEIDDTGYPLKDGDEIEMGQVKFKFAR